MKLEYEITFGTDLSFLRHIPTRVGETWRGELSTFGENEAPTAWWAQNNLIRPVEANQHEWQGLRNRHHQPEEQSSRHEGLAWLVLGNSSRDVAGGVLGWQSMPCD